MNIDGACHCGSISFEANIDPDKAVLCHCTDCQTFSGAPYRASIPVRLDNFRLRGQPLTYVKTGGSGNKVVQHFCGNCGTALFSGAAENATRVNLRLGWVKQRAQIAPTRQGFCDSGMPWAFDITQIPKVPARTPGGEPAAG
jgi:hypothetical protein